MRGPRSTFREGNTDAEKVHSKFGWGGEGKKETTMKEGLVSRSNYGPGVGVEKKNAFSPEAGERKRPWSLWGGKAYGQGKRDGHFV